MRERAAGKETENEQKDRENVKYLTAISCKSTADPFYSRLSDIYYNQQTTSNFRAKNYADSR